MDMDHHGRPDLSDRLVQTYSRAAGDPQVLALIDFYKCYRAAVRGKVEGFRLTQPEVRPAERREARQAARAYFRLACRYAAAQPPPALIITCGLVATGKTAVARSLGEALDAPVISSDVVRKELAGLSSGEHRFEPFERGIYSPAFTASTYDTMLERGRALLAQGRSVLLDATFGRLDQRQKARTLAEEMGARFVCVECRAEEAAIRRRLAERLRAGGDASDARPEIYEAQVQVFEPITELLPHEQVSLDCDRPLGQCVLEARRLVGERLAPPA
jgi:predicted kinase